MKVVFLTWGGESARVRRGVCSCSSRQTGGRSEILMLKGALLRAGASVAFSTGALRALQALTQPTAV